MTAPFIAVAPLVLTFVLGVLLRKLHIFRHQDADILLKLFFYLCLPALILHSVSTLELQLRLLFLPVLAVVIISITYVAARLISPRLHLPQRVQGVFFVGALVMNGGFTFPYIWSACGDTGLAQATLFDFGTGLVVFTVVYYLACRHGSHSSNRRQLLRKFVLSPPLAALLIALLLNLTATPLPTIILRWLELLSHMTTPVVMLALGLTFRPSLVHTGPLVTTVILRIGLGFILGSLGATALGLDGVTRQVVVMMASAPSGVNTLVFATMEDLDQEFAAAVVSYSTLIALLWFPFYLCCVV